MKNLKNNSIYLLVLKEIQLMEMEFRVERKVLVLSKLIFQERFLCWDFSKSEAFIMISYNEY